MTTSYCVRQTEVVCAITMSSARSLSAGGMLTTTTGRTLPRYPRSAFQMSPRWMSGRGMMFVFVPDFGNNLRDRFRVHVAVGFFQAARPNDEFMALLFRQPQHALFEFLQAHATNLSTGSAGSSFDLQRCHVQPL